MVPQLQCVSNGVVALWLAPIHLVTLAKLLDHIVAVFNSRHIISEILNYAADERCGMPDDESVEDDYLLLVENRARSPDAEVTERT